MTISDAEAQERLSLIRRHAYGMLEQLETRPGMWATCPEALETQYITLLATLRMCNGTNPADLSDEQQIHRIYRRITSTPGGSNRIPIWRRQEVTMEDAAEYLKKVRAAVFSDLERLAEVAEE